MITLVQNLRIPGNRNTTVCVDSYQDGVLRGRLRSHSGSVQSFSSLSQFLMLMEALLNRANEPQSATAHRSFSAYLPGSAAETRQDDPVTGHRATFELRILFRQHTSWQGVILWREKHREQSFRSVLELILLMDSALREEEGQETA